MSRRDGAALLALGIAAALLLPQVVLLGKLPGHFDYWLQEYVHLAVLHRALHAGTVPLWNGQLAAGTPHLADPQTATLYPLTLFPLLLLPPAAVARLTVPLHVALAGALTYGFARALGLSRTGALAAGLTYSLAPHFAPLEVATFLQQSAAWLPAVLWALHAASERRSAALFAGAGALWALQLLRGYPQTWYATGLCAGAYALARLALEVRRRRPHPPPAVLLLGPLLFAVAGLSLGAVQLLPSLELLDASQRSAGFTLAEASGRGRIGLANLLGVAGPDAEVSGAFPGGVALGLALAGALYGRGRGVWLTLGLAAAALALCLGGATPLWGLLYRLVPGFDALHMPHRMLFLWSLALALLAGWGLDALRRRPPLRPLLALATGVASLAWLGATTLPGASPEAADGAARLAAGLGAVVAGAVLLGRSGLGGARVGGALACGLALLTGADLLAYSLPRLYGTYYPPAAVYAPPPAARWLQARQAEASLSGDGPYRFASATYETADAGEGSKLQDNRRLAFLPPNTNALFPGLDGAHGYLAIRLRETGDLLRAVNDLSPTSRTLSVYDPRSRLLDVLGVRYFVTDAAPTFASRVGGGRTLTAGSEPAIIPVREPLPTAAVELASRLENADGVAAGEAVGTLTVLGDSGERWEVTLRAGDAQPARFDLAPMGQPAVRELRLRALRPGLRWQVDRVVLHTPFSARFRLALADGDLRIWENATALPRAWWVGAYTVAESPSDALERMREGTVAPQRVAVLTAPVPGLAPGADVTPPVSGGGAVGATLTEATANTRRFEVDAPGPGLLVIAETLAPGWQAWVDGRPARLYAANGVFGAVAVTPGRHRVEVRYLPGSVILGGAVSLLSAALLVGAVAAARLRQRGAPGDEAQRRGDAGGGREASAAVDVHEGGGPPGPVERRRVTALRAQGERDPLAGVRR